MQIREYSLKLLTILSFVVLTVGVISAWSTPVAGYEPDIYASTPLIFWIGIFLSYFTSTAIILLSSKENNTIPN